MTLKSKYTNLCNNHDFFLQWSILLRSGKQQQQMNSNMFCIFERFYIPFSFSQRCLLADRSKCQLLSTFFIHPVQLFHAPSSTSRDSGRRRKSKSNTFDRCIDAKVIHLIDASFQSWEDDQTIKSIFTFVFISLSSILHHCTCCHSCTKVIH